jgi:hypothetical protein
LQLHTAYHSAITFSHWLALALRLVPKQRGYLNKLTMIWTQRRVQRTRVLKQLCQHIITVIIVSFCNNAMLATVPTLNFNAKRDSGLHQSESGLQQDNYSTSMNCKFELPQKNLKGLFCSLQSLCFTCKWSLGVSSLHFFIIKVWVKVFCFKFQVLCFKFQDVGFGFQFRAYG